MILSNRCLFHRKRGTPPPSSHLHTFSLLSLSPLPLKDTSKRIKSNKITILLSLSLILYPTQLIQPMKMATRRGKWHQTPAQTPRILNLPRRSRSSRSGRIKPVGNLISLFELEKRVRAESAPVSPSRHRDDDSGEEKWRFQAEMLRAECNFLRMEREVAVRKLDRHRGQMEAALKSAMETLVSVSTTTRITKSFFL